MSVSFVSLWFSRKKKNYILTKSSCQPPFRDGILNFRFNMPTNIEYKIHLCKKLQNSTSIRSTFYGGSIYILGTYFDYIHADAFLYICRYKTQMANMANIYLRHLMVFNYPYNFKNLLEKQQI